MIDLLPLLAWGVGFGALASIPSGPASVLVIRNTLRAGRSAGLVTVAGMLVGDGLHAVLVGVGLGPLVLGTPWIRAPLFVVGSIMLVALGIASWRSRPPPPDAEEQLAGRRVWFREAVLATLTNPGLQLFYGGAVASAGLALGESTVRPHLLLYMAAVLVGTVVWFTALVLILDRLTGRTADWVRDGIGKVAGVLLIGVGGYLAVDLVAQLVSASS